MSALIVFVGGYLAPNSLRRLQSWDAEVTADVMSNILQPGRFAQLAQSLTMRIRERQPGGLLVGIFIDDRRDPAQRVSIIADHGFVTKSQKGSFLILEDGHLERFELDKKEPAMVAFTRYAFDMSMFSNRSVGAPGPHERYLWELFNPDPEDPVFKQIPGQYRSELHDRLTAPLYALAFTVMTFAFLGIPRTTRQSRNFSMGCAISAVFALRAAGFACSVVSQRSDMAVLVQYAMLSVCLAVGFLLIGKGTVIEPPTVVMDAIQRSNNRIKRLLRMPVAVPT